MNIGVIYGSRSPEHEVSITSGFGVMQAILKHTTHTPIPLYITKEGNRIVDEKLRNLAPHQGIDTSNATLFPQLEKNKGTVRVTQTAASSLFKKPKKYQIDYLRNMCHGENGEDGIISGFANLTNLPIVSVGHLAEAISVDKGMMKKVFTQLNLPLVPYQTYTKETYSVQDVEKNLHYPLFVKPVHLGSSIGISKCNNATELATGVEVAFHYDSMIMVEEAVENLQEINCSVLEKEEAIITSKTEEPSTTEAFLTFEEKYTSETGSTMKGAKGKVNIPADIPPAIEEKIYAHCKTIYQGLHMQGGAPRIDFLYERKEQKLYVNEVNVTPGSMQVHLRKSSGRTISQFIETLLQTAQYHHQKKQKEISFQSSILEHTISYLSQHAQ